MHFSSIYPEVLAARIVLFPFFTVQLNLRDNSRDVPKADSRNTHNRKLNSHFRIPNLIPPDIAPYIDNLVQQSYAKAPL